MIQVATFPRRYPMMTPDSLRAKTHIDKKFFGTFLSRSFMRTHTNGTKYVGTMENWGSEMLLESHKLKMRYTPFQALKFSPAVKRYFDLHYGDSLDSLHQPTPILCCLKKDSIPPFETCYIQFEDCVKDVILRAPSTTEKNPTIQTVFRTTTPPKFVIDGDVLPPSQLTMMDPIDPDGEVLYFFNTTTPNATLNNQAEYTRNFIDYESYTVDENTGKVSFSTIPLQPWMVGQPFIWCSIPGVSILENGNIIGNEDQNENPLMTFGTDGDDNFGMYPLIYGNDNVPSVNGQYENLKWLVKVYARHDDFTISNYKEKELRKISFCAYTEAPAMKNIVETHDITWDVEKFHVFLNPSAYRSSKTYWVYGKPRSGDSDYDGTTFINPPYLFATTPQGNYEYQEACPPKINDIYYPLFIIKTDIKYNEHRFLTPRAQAGIHVDFSSDYSDHCVDKPNGTIYHMGDFDGLPVYYSTKNARYVKRGRVSLYTLRDWITSYEQKPMKRQSAGLLIDSGMPVLVDSDIGIDGLESVIKYKYSPSRTYTTTGESISKNNCLSDIIYYAGNKFYDVHKKDGPYKMIYHGDRYFSTRVSKDLDQENFGRVYVISNDEAVYENNDSTKNPKPDRTLARICDIPTDYRQLTAVSGLVSSVVIDRWYTRTEACYSDGNVESINGNDLQRVWNVTSNETNLVTDYSSGTFIFDNETNMNSDYGVTWMNLHYPRWNRLNESLTIKDAMATTIVSDKYRWFVINSSKGFSVGNEIMAYVGGHPFNTVVSDLTINGGVRETNVTADTKEVKVNVANFDGRETMYNPVVKTGPTNNDEVTMRLEIFQDTWNLLQPVRSGAINGCFAFKFNQYNQLTIWKYNPVDMWWYENVVLTGDEFEDTIYNEDLDIVINSTTASFMRYITMNKPMQIAGYADAPYTDSLSFRVLTEAYENGVENPNTYGIDFSNDFVSRGYNLQDTYFVLQPDDGTDNTLKRYEMTPLYDRFNVTFPKTNNVALYSNIPRSNGLLYNGLFAGRVDMGYVPKQPNVFLYNPNKNTHTYYISHSSDVISKVKTTPITFKYFPDMLRDSSAALKYHVYKYIGNEMSPEFNEQLRHYHQASRDELYAEAITLNPTFSQVEVNPVEYAEFNSVPYSREQLISYILEFKTKDEYVINQYKYQPTMHSTSIKKIRECNDITFEEVGDKIIPYDEQPTGDVIPVSATVHNHNVNIGDSNASTTTKPMYVMKLDDTVNIESFDGFHMRDQHSNLDISDKTLLIYKKEMYTYSSTYDTWKKIYRG